MLRCLLAAALLALAARCAGAYTVAEARAPMTATLVGSDAGGRGTDGPGWLALTGRIGFDTPAVLRAALARLGTRRVPVLLDSPGGESSAALAMGRMIRARGLDTAVASTALTDCAPEDGACAARRRAGVRPGHVGTGGAGVATCASACVFLLAAGQHRDVPLAASVGVHQAMRIVTTRPRAGYWRILSRIVGGRRVEVSRTLVITRVLPERVTKGAAPESLYAEFGRFFAGMGIAPEILPLMRATPPSGIHWMTPAEIAATRIATDDGDAAALVEREAASQSAAASLRAVPAPAALTLDDGRRWVGAVS